MNINHPNSNPHAKILLPKHTIIGMFFVFDNPIQINQSILSYIHHTTHSFSGYLIGNKTKLVKRLGHHSSIYNII